MHKTKCLFAFCIWLLCAIVNCAPPKSCLTDQDCSDKFCIDGFCRSCKQICGEFSNCQRDGNIKCSCLVGFTKDEGESCRTNSPQRLADALPGNVASSVHDFTQTMLTQVWSESNVVFSPLSIHAALAILTSGATDNSATQRELLNALGRSNNIQALENFYHNIFSDLRNNVADKKYPVSIGNKVWTSQFWQIRDSFEQRASRNYDADVELLDESPSVAANQVNQWVSSVTRGKITNLVDSVEGDTKLMITNAVHFKDGWDVAFYPLPPDATEQFQLENGTKVDVNMMTRSSESLKLTAPFRFDDVLPQVEFSAVSVPYEYDGGQRFEMVVVVPVEEHRGLLLLGDALARKQTDHKNIMDKILEELQIARESDDEIELTMPEFNIKTDVNVVDNLRKMGINAAFEEGGFGKISSESLRLDSVKHQAVIEVTYQGTEAAAASSLEVVPLFGIFTRPKEVHVNKPFLFIIRDIQQNVPLFVGKVNQPPPQSETYVSPFDFEPFE